MAQFKNSNVLISKYNLALTLPTKRLILKNYKGFSEQLRLAEMLGACAKKITAFSKICENKHLEADLIMHVLEIPFSLNSNSFTTCFTAYNYKVVLLLKRVITLVESKMHEDYKIQYQSKINDYLNILHHTSSYLDYVYALPKSIFVGTGPCIGARMRSWLAA